MVSTLDSESSDLSSNLSGTLRPLRFLFWKVRNLNVLESLGKTFAYDMKGASQNIQPEQRWSWLPSVQGLAQNNTDLRFNVWIKKGVNVFHQIVQDNQMKSFVGLKESFGLEKLDFCRYFQIKTYYNQEMTQSNDH